MEAKEGQQQQQRPHGSKSSKLDIWVSGINFPKSSCVNLYQRTAFTRKNWVMFASTELVLNTKDPKYTHQLFFQYFFSVKQEIRAEIIDIESKSLAGSVEFNFATLLTAHNQSLKLSVQKTYPAYSNDESLLCLRIDNFTESFDEVRLLFSASFHKSYIFTPKTFITIWQMDPNEKKFLPVLRGETYEGDVPIWPIVRSKAIDLCGKDLGRTLRVVIHKIPKIHQEKVMGHVDFTLNDIFYGKLKSTDIIKFSQKPGEPLQKTKIGKLFFQNKQLVRAPQFLNYVFAGLDLFSVIALDFSNRGNSYVKPESAHYCLDGEESLYEKTAKLFVDVLLPYSANKKIVCYGFGANKVDLMNDCIIEKRSACFQLSESSQDSLYSEPSALSKDYRTIIQALEPCQIKGYMPIVMEILESLKKDGHFASLARYYNIILLIEQDIQDLQEIIDYLTSIGGQVPITLFLVGVGSGAYKNLKSFDVSSGKSSEQDSSKGDTLEPSSIVFLALDDVKGGPFELTKELLKLLPERVYTGMVKRNISAEQGTLAVNKKSSKLSDPIGPNPLNHLVAVKKAAR